MNKKTAIGLLVALVVIGIAAYVLQKKVPETVEIPLGNAPAETGAPVEASSATGTPSGRPPALVEQVGETRQSAPRITAYDQASLKTGSSNPVITGTANVSMVGIVIEDSTGVGIIGSHEIPVEKGHWSFPVPQKLKPGTYIIYLIGGDDVVVTSMAVK